MINTKRSLILPIGGLMLVAFLFLLVHSCSSGPRAEKKQAAQSYYDQVSEMRGETAESFNLIVKAYSSLILPEEPPSDEERQNVMNEIGEQLKVKQELEKTLEKIPEFDQEIPIKSLTLAEIRRDQKLFQPEYWDSMHINKEQSTTDSNRVYNNLLDLIEEIVTQETASYEAFRKFEKKYQLPPAVAIHPSIKKGMEYLEENR